MEFKDKVKMLREKNNMTLEDVAKRAGVSTPTIQRYESGDIKNVRNDKIESLANALHTTPSYLMGWEDIVSNYELDIAIIRLRKYGVGVKYVEDKELGEQYTVITYRGEDYGEVGNELCKLYRSIKKLSPDEIRDKIELFFSEIKKPIISKSRQRLEKLDTDLECVKDRLTIGSFVTFDKNMHIILDNFNSDKYKVVKLNFGESLIRLKSTDIMLNYDKSRVESFFEDTTDIVMRRLSDYSEKSAKYLVPFWEKIRNTGTFISMLNSERKMSEEEKLKILEFANDVKNVSESLAKITPPKDDELSESLSYAFRKKYISLLTSDATINEKNIDVIKKSDIIEENTGYIIRLSRRSLMEINKKLDDIARNS